MTDQPTNKATGAISPMEALLAYERKGGKVLFWVCPKGCDGYVDWQSTKAGHIATCKTCGCQSQPQNPR